MPQVPTLDNFSVAPSGGGFTPVAATPVKQSAPEQLQQMGQAVQRTSTQAADLFRDAQVQANQLRVDDAVNRAKERAMQLTFDPQEGFTTLKGLDAIERPEGKSLADDYGTQLQSSLDQIAGGLGNDVQRRAFAQAAQGLRTGFDADLMKHESSEFRDYSLSVREGTIATSQREISLKYSDPETVGRNMLSIQAAVYDQAHLLGKSASWAEAQARNMTSSAHRLAMTSALENNDIGFVQQYLDSHGKEMNADDVIAVNGAVTKQQQFTYGTAAADKVFAGVSSEGVAPEPVRMPVAGRITSAYGARDSFTTANGARSSSNHDGIDIAAPEGSAVAAAATGKVVYAGTKGGYGNYVEVEHADGSHSFYGHLSSIGVKKGDQIAGGAALGKVGSTGNSTGPHLHWGMRDASGKSVDPRNMRSVGGGKGVGSNASLIEMIQAVGSDPYLAAHPEARQVAEQRVRSLYQAREESRQQGDEQATAATMRALVQNGGQLTPQMLARVPDKGVQSVVGFANSIQSANRQRRDDNDNRHGDPLLWAGLKGKIAAGEITSPDQLVQYAPRLSNSDFRGLAADVVSMQSGDQKKIDSYTTVDRTLKYIHGEMLDAGIDWTPDAKDPDAAKKFATFQDKLLRQIGTLEQVNGKPLTGDEARGVALKMLAEVPNSGDRSMFGLSRGANKRGYELGQPVLPLNVVPRTVQQRAIQTLRQSGFPATERNVRRVIAGGEPLRGG